MARILAAFLSALLAVSRADQKPSSPLPTQHAYQDGKTLRLPINETATEELLDKWMSQALSGLMAAVASGRLNQMDTDDREEVHRCSKAASTVPQHAKCVVKVLDSTKPVKRVRILKNKPAIHVKHKPFKVATKRSKGKPIRKSRKREWVGGFRMARAKRSTSRVGSFEVVNRSSYNIPSTDDDTIFAKVARQMTKTIRKFKNKPGRESWRSTVQRIKVVGAEARRAKKRRDALKKRLRQMIDNTPDEFQDPRKPLAMKQLDAQDEEALRKKKAIQRKQEEVRVPMRMLRESIKMALVASGKNVTNFDKKTLKLISPRFLSLVPEQNDTELFNFLSPSLFSLHQEGDQLEKAMSLKHMLKQLPNKEQEAWLDFIVEAAGVTDAVDKAEKKQREMREEEMRGKDGVPLYFTKENVTGLFGDVEKRKIETFEALDKSYTLEQKDDLERLGYAFLNSKQLDIVYGSNSPYNKSDSLRMFKRLQRLKDDPHHLVEHDIRALAEAKKFRVRQKDITLSPFVLSPITLAPAATSQPIVLSPLVLSPIILSPAVLGPIILSPWVFIPLILSPRVLSPLILNPLVFSPIILSPVALHPFILVPGVFNPVILSPLILSPLILSPQVFSPLILSPFALSPLILTPMAGSPLILSPFALSPIIYSPQFYSAVILSPYAMSPLIESKLVQAEVILSPSWLS
ncbi:hypothetical protein Y032_0449g1670 [Ancylostoma ceylanicum]|uniref:Uncharacterized protein n=1 Tax=Ancylostoma ceylanicum TaxID=53326 RepID=A0A016X0L5_9BILA|nr:hypothetical protein Y032_0449g1670 [Ancylostoma ceylanicum]